MDSATVHSTSYRPLQLESIPAVDLHLISQHELNALSLCSDGKLNTRRCNDAIIPKIDRSIFNESAGSRRQTYDRLRLAPAGSTTAIRSCSCSRTPHLISPIRPPIAVKVVEGDDVTKDNVVSENVEDTDREIVNKNGTSVVDMVSNSNKRKRGRPRKNEVQVGQVAVKAVGGDDATNYIVEDRDKEIVNNNAMAAVVDMVSNVRKKKRGRPRKDEHRVVPVAVKAVGGDGATNVVVFQNIGDRDSDIVNKNDATVVDMVSNVRKRKKGRPRKNVNTVLPVAANVVSENIEDRDRETVNKNGVVVDMVALSCLEDPYGLELRRRTEGLVTKEELLEFLGGLNGEWGSTRKKRKIVDASDFGDALPKGWKLLLSLKKKRGRVWLFCRRYISPNGRQFVSCKEVSSYVLSVSGLQGSNLPNCAHSNVGIQSAYKMASGNGAQLAATEDHKKENLVCDPSSAITFICRNHEKQIILTSPFPNEQACRVENNESRVSARVEEQNQEAVFESGLLAPNGDDRCFTSIMDEFKLDREKFAKDESISCFYISHAGVDEDNVTGVEQHTSSEGRSLVPSRIEQFYNMNGVTTATSKIGSESRIPTSFADEETCGVEENLSRVSTSYVVPKRDGMYDFGGNGRGSYAGSDVIAVTSLEEEKHFESCSVVSSWNEQANVMENYGNEVSTGTVEELKHQVYSESSLNFLSDYEQNYGAENYVDKLSTRKMEPPKLNEVQTWRNSEQLSFPFGSRLSGLNADGASLVTSIKERTIEFCSVVPSGNEQTFPVQSNVIEAEQTFGVQTNLCGVNNSMVEDPKKGRDSMSDLFSFSFNGEICCFNNSVYTDRGWEGHKVGEVGNSENKFMIGFGSGHIQPDEDVLGGIWRTGEENALQCGLADTPDPLVQSSSSFSTFDMISDKAEDGFFRLGEKYGSEQAFEGLRLGRTEPVEVSFLTTQYSSSSRQGDSKGFSYESEMEQEFDPSFRLGRDALMPNVVGRDQVTTTNVCVWCRNEFRQEQPVHSVAPAAIGFMCPTCREKISDTR